MRWLCRYDISAERFNHGAVVPRLQRNSHSDCRGAVERRCNQRTKATVYAHPLVRLSIISIAQLTALHICLAN